METKEMKEYSLTVTYSAKYECWKIIEDLRNTIRANDDANYFFHRSPDMAGVVGEKTHKIVLFHFEEGASTEEVLAIMEKAGTRPAGLYELAAMVLASFPLSYLLHDGKYLIGLDTDSHRKICIGRDHWEEIHLDLVTPRRSKWGSKAIFPAVVL